MIVEPLLNPRSGAVTSSIRVALCSDVQWMTAGRGIIHSEIPHGESTVHSLQLWLNLPKSLKMWVSVQCPCGSHAISVCSYLAPRCRCACSLLL